MKRPPNRSVGLFAAVCVSVVALSMFASVFPAPARAASVMGSARPQSSTSLGMTVTWNGADIQTAST
ncbi:MAG TPA: hypothetical protein VLY85_01855, partial [Thermoplasmata archaeon]|nr:hypothetical protein [Thermoplasmata archaeon]